MSLKIQIERELESLLGKPLVGLGRAADMLWLGFGDPCQITNFKGKERSVSEFALHVQSAWRFIKEGRIALASGDLYLDSVTKFADDGRSPLSRFDSEVPLFSSREVPATVKSVAADEMGGVVLIFDSGLHFEIVVMDSAKEEKWRFFSNKSEADHFVVPLEQSGSLRLIK
ncbi:MAG: hypothetical protein J0M12_13785 [Deltaproteobacteria bacterium]|nr:hypothetical protein [Deltaproteobacteria bacterium]